MVKEVLNKKVNPRGCQQLLLYRIKVACICYYFVPSSSYDRPTAYLKQVFEESRPLDGVLKLDFNNNLII